MAHGSCALFDLPMAFLGVQRPLTMLGDRGIEEKSPRCLPPLWIAVIGGKYCTVAPYAVVRLASVRLKDEETVVGNVISRNFGPVRVYCSFLQWEWAITSQRSVSCVTADLGKRRHRIGQGKAIIMGMGGIGSWELLR